MPAFDELISALVQGRDWPGMGDADRTRHLLDATYAERYHRAAHHAGRYQTRVNLQKKDDAASYAGWITSENPTSGPYQGTSFVWIPGVGGSVAVLVIGTDGFGADTHVLGRPGHARRLHALNRLHRGKLWVKPDLPVPVQAQIREAASKALAQPGARERLQEVGFEPGQPRTPEQLSASLKADYDRVGAVLKAIGFKPE